MWNLSTNIGELTMGNVFKWEKKIDGRQVW